MVTLLKSERKNSESKNSENLEKRKCKIEGVRVCEGEDEGKGALLYFSVLFPAFSFFRDYSLSLFFLWLFYFSLFGHAISKISHSQRLFEK